MAPSKRKKSAATATATAMDSLPSNPKSAKLGPRRSARHLPEVNPVPVPESGATMCPAPGQEATDEPSAKRRHVSRNKVEAFQEGVRNAVIELSEMENRLQNATRTSRLAVEASSIALRSDAGRSEETSFRPRLKTRPTDPEDRARKDEEERSGTPNMDAAPINGPDGEAAICDVENDKIREEDAPERGAAREPPINSAYLPLPWNGRLGYVRPACSEDFEPCSLKVDCSTNKILFPGLSQYIPSRC